MAHAMSGFILIWIGFQISKGVAQSESTLSSLRAVFSFVPVFGAGLSLLLLKWYPLSKDRMHQIRLELDRRSSERKSMSSEKA